MAAAVRYCLGGAVKDCHSWHFRWPRQSSNMQREGPCIWSRQCGLCDGKTGGERCCLIVCSARDMYTVHRSRLRGYLFPVPCPYCVSAAALRPLHAQSCLRGWSAAWSEGRFRAATAGRCHGNFAMRCGVGRLRHCRGLRLTTIRRAAPQGHPTLATPSQQVFAAPLSRNPAMHRRGPRRPGIGTRCTCKGAALRATQLQRILVPLARRNGGCSAVQWMHCHGCRRCQWRVRGSAR
jgi:hypothetical protein